MGHLHSVDTQGRQFAIQHCPQSSGGKTRQQAEPDLTPQPGVKGSAPASWTVSLQPQSGDRSKQKRQGLVSGCSPCLNSLGSAVNPCPVREERGSEHILCGADQHCDLFTPPVRSAACSLLRTGQLSFAQVLPCLQMQEHPCGCAGKVNRMLLPGV